MATTIATMIQEVAPDVPGCPQPLIAQTMTNVLREFFNMTQVANKSMEVDSPTVDEPSELYPCMIPPINIAVPYPLSGYSVSEIMRLRIDHRDYKTEKQEVIDETAESLNLVPHHRLKYWYPEADGSISLTPFHAAPSTIFLRVALIPTSAAASIEDEIYELYHEAIVSGVKARLMFMPKKTWTDQKTGMYFEARYKAARTAAIIRVSATESNRGRTEADRPGYL